MTSLLFIPTTFDAHQHRRIDFARMASLFAEADEPTLAPRLPDSKTRLIASVLILLCAFGDTVLIARPVFLMSNTFGQASIGGTKAPAHS